MDFQTMVNRVHVMWKYDEITNQDYLAFLRVAQEVGNKWGEKFPNNVLPHGEKPLYPGNME